MGRYVHVWTTGGWTFWPASMHTQFLKPRTARMPWLAQSCSRCSTWFWVITRFQSRKKTSPKQQAGSVRVHHHVVWVDKCAVYIPAGDRNNLQRSSVVKMPHLPGGCSYIWQDAIVCSTSLMASLIRSVGGLSKYFYQGLWLADLNADVVGQSMNRRGVA